VRRAHRPAGERATTERAAPSLAISRAVQPPTEWPAMCAVGCPSCPRKSVRTPAKPAGSGGGPADVKGGEAPKPGRSTAMTVMRAASRSTSGSQMRRLLPVPWTSSRGSPVPRTSWRRSCTRGGLDAVVLIVARFPSAWGGGLTAPVLYSTGSAATTPQGAPRLPPLPGRRCSSSVLSLPPTLLAVVGRGAGPRPRALPSFSPACSTSYLWWALRGAVLVSLTVGLYERFA